MKKDNYVLLEPQNFTPIDIIKTKEKWEKINNIPNSSWVTIEKNLKIINNDILPLTFRTFVLNNLPYCVVIILMNNSS